MPMMGQSQYKFERGPCRGGYGMRFDAEDVTSAGYRMEMRHWLPANLRYAFTSRMCALSLSRVVRAPLPFGPCLRRMTST